MAGSNRCRYLFTETDDVYYTDSLIQLDFKKYLYWLLRRENYESIWFLKYSGNDNKMEISCMDKGSKGKCENRLPKAGILFLKPQTLLEGKGQFYTKQEVYETGNVIGSLINEKHRKYAFVLPPQDFEKLFNEKLKQQFTESKYQSDLIITCEAGGAEEYQQTYPDAFQGYDEEAESEALLESDLGQMKQMELLVQRYCLLKMNTSELPNRKVFKNLLVGNEFKADGKKVSLSGFAENLVKKMDDHSNSLTFHTRRELNERFLNDNLFWDYWESYEGE